MPAPAERLLDLLQERKLLPLPMIEGLRRQVNASPEQFNAHHVAKLLQRKGKITPFQARELLAELEGRDVDTGPSSEAEVPPSQPPAPAQGDEELGLAEEDAPAVTKTAAKTPEITDEASSQLTELPTLESSNEPASVADLSGLDDPFSSAQPFGDPLNPAAAQSGLPGGKNRKRLAAGWDSPLIIVGGGVLLLLLLVGAVLSFVLSRESGDGLYAAAEQDYLDGAYGQSISKFEKFVSRHGSHPDVSMARVRIALAKLRIETSTKNWPQALQRAQEVLPDIEEEPALGQARGELAALLPDIASGFADLATEETDLKKASEIVEQFDAAMELVDNPAYLPASQRAGQNARIESSRATIATVVRKIEEESRLDDTVAEIHSLVGSDDVMQAYAKRDELLKQYPQLVDAPDLAAAVRSVSDQLAVRVVTREESIKASTDDHKSPVVGSAALADVEGEEIAELAGRIVPFVIDGVLYALAADSGDLLWRRFVGQDTATATPVSSAADADLLVVDSTREELLRLRASDGELVWRLPIGERCALAEVVGERIHLAVLDRGEIWEVDSKSGDSNRQVQFPQPLAAAPRLTERGHFIQVADHSNIYVLDPISLKCQDVYFLGHAQGTVPYPPVDAAGIVLVPHQVGMRRSILHVLRETSESPLLSQAQSAWAMDGRFAAPLLAEGLRVGIFDQRGKLTLLGVDPANDETPVEVVAEASSGNQTFAVQADIADGYLVVGSDRLSAFRIATAQGILAPRWVNHIGDDFVAPIQIIGDYVLHARREQEKAGVVITATSRDAPQAQEAGRPIWKNRIAPAAPQGGWQLSPDGTRLVAISTIGNSYEFSTNLETHETLNAPHRRSDRPGEYLKAIPMDGRTMALLGRDAPPIGSDGRAIFSEPAANNISAYDFTSAIVWRGDILTPSKLGRIDLLQSTAESPSLYPFQPRLELNDQVTWLRPAAIDEKQFAAITRRGDVYLAGISNRGAGHLSAIAQTRLALPPAAAPMVFQNRLAVVARGERCDTVVSFALPSLSGDSRFDLPGRLRWGPYVVDDLLLIATTPGDLQAYDPQGDLRWTFALDGKLPVGPPVSQAGLLAIAATDGTLFRVSRDDGELNSHTSVGQPLCDGPIVVGNRIALRAADGSVLFVAEELSDLLSRSDN